jgi:hypothetical protein
MVDQAEVTSQCTVVHGILVELLSEVTPTMLEAASRALLDLETSIDARGRRQFRPGVSEDMRLATVWRAMLAAKLGDSL